MPALLDDPTSPVIYRASGEGPYPTAENPQIPSSIFPRPVTLRDRVTIATLIPFFSHSQVPKGLLAYLCENLNKEIEGGDTYPMINPLSLDTFGPYWFGNFGAVMVLGDVGGIEAVDEMERDGVDWSKVCLGSFYVKPNYPGRSSHVCNGGFLVTPAARNKGVGKSMGQCYLDWAPQLGFTYSVFNLVYETNTASTRIWDSLGFKRIGRVPGCGNLKSSEEPVDAIIYGRDLKSEGEDVASEERFDKIRYYLRHQLYPQGADRSEKSRLRSAATHYRLVGGENGEPERLFLKKKEVISDPQSQYDIAQEAHLKAHGGINKTTAMISTNYHWIRIKETVAQVIKNCPKCKDSNKPLNLRSDISRVKSKKRSRDFDKMTRSDQQDELVDPFDKISQGRLSHDDHMLPTQVPMHDETHMADEYDEMAIDPQIMQQIQAQLVSEYRNDHDDYEEANLADFAARHLAETDGDQHDFAAVQDDHFMADDQQRNLPGSHAIASSDAIQSMQAGQIPHNLATRGYIGSNG